MSETPLLESLQDNFGLLKTYSLEQLTTLCQEIRDQLCWQLNDCGGHFGANLGVVELTVALHYVFETPNVPLIWDVGHQAYPHKMLTARLARLKSIRQQGGLAPFPSREESPFDAFGVGHSSTSISAALGMSMAARHQGVPDTAIAIIGDGAMTGGMAFEAMNHAAGEKANVLLILNDNRMSISHNVGALSRYLSQWVAGGSYRHIRETSKRWLSNKPKLRSFAKHMEQQFKGLFTPGMLFESLGFDYCGPIPGHDLGLLIDILEKLKQVEGPKLLHIITQKGKGHKDAEADPVGYHAVKPGFLNSNTSHKASTTYSNIFGKWMLDTAQKDERLLGITPAMKEGSDLVTFSNTYPKRYFDVGIAEQHALTLAAGMACQGQKPVVAIYSTFLQRAYDQLIHDIALQQLDVTFAIDRAGLVGGDGATHQGAFDIAYLRCIPNMIILTPANEAECYAALDAAYAHPGPAAVRYPRGTGPGIFPPLSENFSIGKAKIIQQGEKLALLAFGDVLYDILPIAEELHATVVNMRSVKPLDEALLREIASTHQHLITLENGSRAGGAGSAVLEYLSQLPNTTKVQCLGFDDVFIGHGARVDFKNRLLQLILQDQLN